MMQASKIVIGRIYAISEGNRLVRFRVTEVVTRRINNYGNPHDYSSTVVGSVVQEDRLDADTPEPLTLDPQRLLGPYEEQAELKARDDAEKAERDRASQERENNRIAVTAWLYSFVGLPVASEEEQRYHAKKAPFRKQYSGIEITDAGVTALLAKINQ